MLPTKKAIWAAKDRRAHVRHLHPRHMTAAISAPRCGGLPAPLWRRAPGFFRMITRKRIKKILTLSGGLDVRGLRCWRTHCCLQLAPMGLRQMFAAKKKVWPALIGWRNIYHFAAAPYPSSNRWPAVGCMVN